MKYLILVLIMALGACGADSVNTHFITKCDVDSQGQYYNCVTSRVN